MSALLRLPSVIDQVGLQRTAIYDRINDGLFPAPIKLGPRVSVWPAHEVEACNDAIIRGNSPEQIRTLVQQLHARRMDDLRRAFETQVSPSATASSAVIATRPAALSLDGVAAYLSLSPSTVQKLAQQDGEFPKPVELSKRRVAWRIAELDAWLASRPRSTLLPPKNCGHGRKGATKNRESGLMT